MRYELTDNEWSAIKSMLPNKPRGVPRVNDRRVINGIFWVLRSGAPWRDLRETYRTKTFSCSTRWAARPISHCRDDGTLQVDHARRPVAARTDGLGFVKFLPSGRSQRRRQW